MCGCPLKLAGKDQEETRVNLGGESMQLWISGQSTIDSLSSSGTKETIHSTKLNDQNTKILDQETLT